MQMIMRKIKLKVSLLSIFLVWNLNICIIDIVRVWSSLSGVHNENLSLKSQEVDQS